MTLALQWPAGLTEEAFLNDYWQKKSLLLKQALADFQTPIDPDELAGLSLEQDVSARLVLHSSDDQYQMESGPFEASRFESLTGHDWSLLVTDVEKHIPDFRQYLQPFSFLPSWRIDDLMISYAPLGASVGAHVDEYDVFLLQASGTRRWEIDTSASPNLTVKSGSGLKILEHFQPNEQFDLVPGDILYLPPGVPHHGHALSDNCTTWSIGFRAPTQINILSEFAENLAESLEAQHFRDPPLKRACPGEITAESLQAIEQLWKAATQLSEDQLIALSGKLLTTPPGTDIERFAENKDPDSGLSWSRHPFSRFAFIGTGEYVDLFVDSENYSCSRSFAQQLCEADDIDLNKLSDQENKLVQTLIREGCMLPNDED